MIYVTIITSTGFERKTFHAADHVMAYIQTKKDVLGYKCIQVPSPKRKKVKEL